MKITTLDELFEDELRDIYNAETQLVHALPKLAKVADSKDLRAAFEKHLEQTRVHAQRVEDICNDLKIKPAGKVCAGMQGVQRYGCGAQAGCIDRSGSARRTLRDRRIWNCAGARPSVGLPEGVRSVEQNSPGGKRDRPKVDAFSGKPGKCQSCHEQRSSGHVQIV